MSFLLFFEHNPTVNVNCDANEYGVHLFILGLLESGQSSFFFSFFFTQSCFLRCFSRSSVFSSRSFSTSGLLTFDCPGPRGTQATKDVIYRQSRQHLLYENNVQGCVKTPTVDQIQLRTHTQQSLLHPVIILHTPSGSSHVSNTPSPL